MMFKHIWTCLCKKYFSTKIDLQVTLFGARNTFWDTWVHNVGDTLLFTFQAAEMCLRGGKELRMHIFGIG